MLAHEFDKQFKLWAMQRQADIRPAHVVNHHGGGQGGEKIPQLGQIHCLKINHDMPAEFGNSAGNFQQFIFGREINQPFDEVEAHAAHARCVQG